MGSDPIESAFFTSGVSLPRIMSLKALTYSSVEVGVAPFLPAVAALGLPTTGVEVAAESLASFSACASTRLICSSISFMSSVILSYWLRASADTRPFSSLCSSRNFFAFSHISLLFALSSITVMALPPLVNEKNEWLLI